MTKIKFPKKAPRSIVRKRHDHPTSLFVTIPKKIVKDWQLKAGQIIEFSTLVEGQDIFVKLRKVTEL
ncbi:MAG TPA: hypothetical protein VGJ42_01850 [Nitrososphaera sp.]